jgi:penicillin-binding protein A
VNRQIRYLGIGLAACYLALFAMLNWVQVLQADDYGDHPLNTAKVRRDFNRPRGAITTSDGVVIARSVDNPDPQSALSLLREYPEGELFGHVTGFFSFQFGASGVERQYSAELAGQTFEQQVRGFADLFVDRDTVGNVTVTLSRELQQIARDQLGQRQGSVVALDVKTGEILTFWSFPSFDPNLLAGSDMERVEENWVLLNLATGAPLRPHQYQDRYFPGSTFKVVTASTGLQSGAVTSTSPVYPTESSYTPPQTDLPIRNFGGQSCGGDLFEILARSCNTAFARMAVEDIGPQAMTQGAEAFGFNAAVPIDLPNPTSSTFPTSFERDLPKLAQVAFGQNEVQATPLEMALVAAAVANDGRIMRPHVLSEIRDSDENVVDRFDQSVWREPLDPQNARTMRDAMIGVVEGGTASMMALPGFEIGAKTGTAETVRPDGSPGSHTWMIAFGGPPGDPQVAVAAVVLDQPPSSDFTGGQIAGPIARAVLEAALRGRTGG